MLKRFLRKDPYQYIVDFIDMAAESEEISSWLIILERLPLPMRMIRLAEIQRKLVHAHVPPRFAETLQLLNNPSILQAMNLVIKELTQSGMQARKYARRKENTSYALLLGLISAAAPVKMVD